MNVIACVKVGSRGQGSLIRREGIAAWYFRYSHRGEEHEESTKTPDLKAAKRFAKNKLDEMAVDRKGKGAYQPALAARVTAGELLDDLMTDYRLRGVKSLLQIQSHLTPIREAFGAWRAADVTGPTIDRYIEQCQAAGIAAATINRRLQILRQAFRLAYQADVPKVIHLPRVRHLPEKNVRQGFFEADEFARLAAALPADLRDLAAFGYLTGWRLGEITSLRWEWVDRASDEIRLPDSKHGHGRILA